MFSIGILSKQTAVKVPTIRYYEQIGLIDPPCRTSGNQRRYTQASLERLQFIKHARELGFSIEAIAALIELNHHPDKSCVTASEIAHQQLADIQSKIIRLQRLETELLRITKHCQGDGMVSDCYVLHALGDHGQCDADH